jgi:DNA ligase (NAD+)
MVAMLSLDNSYSADDLTSFDRKARELTKMDKIEYCVEPKFDAEASPLFMRMICSYGALQR